MAAANGLLTFCQVIFGLDGISDPSHPNPTETSLSRIFRNKPEIVPSTNVMMMNDNFEGSEEGRMPSMDLLHCLELAHYKEHAGGNDGR